MDLEKIYTNYLRRAQQRSCTLCPGESKYTRGEFLAHVKSTHRDYLGRSVEESLDEDITTITKLWNGLPAASLAAGRSEQRGRASAVFASSLKREETQSQSQPTDARGKAASPPSAEPDASDFIRSAPRESRLWTPEADGTRHGRFRLSQQGNDGRQPRTSRPAPTCTEEDPPRMIKQPETRPISQEQLVADVKGIYAGLFMVESKCIEVDSMQKAQQDTTGNKLNNEQWQALIALHRTLLHEHHDFFLASQHPSASAPLRRLASKYAMPARIWRHGIHSFLELLRARLPASREHMLSFIYLAYSMMALLYETVPTFEDTWIECLGDLGRYRMAIEDDDMKDREVWTAMARHWYAKASDKSPTTGRLYHHLAILARPNAVQQLFYYAKSLCVHVPCDPAHTSVMALFGDLMASQSRQGNLAPAELHFVRAHATLFANGLSRDLDPSIHAFEATLDSYIARTARNFNESGYLIAITNCCAILGYGSGENAIFREIQDPICPSKDSTPPDSNDTMKPELDQLTEAVGLSNISDQVVLSRFGDANILSYLHVRLAFLYHLLAPGVSLLQEVEKFPWKLVALQLNSMLSTMTDHIDLRDTGFPLTGGQRPLPEDFAMRGLLWTDRYFPDDYFQNEWIDDDEQHLEIASMAEQRRERCLYLGIRIAERGSGLCYDHQSRQFYTATEDDVTVAPISPSTGDYGDQHHCMQPLPRQPILVS